MILTDREIKIHLERKIIEIDPAPEPNAFSSTSVDLTLDSILSEFKPPAASGLEQAIDPTTANFKGEEIINALTERKTITDEGYLLQPRKLVLAWTREFINLKYDARLAARIEGKSSLARLGLAVHITAPTIHSGFTGRIRLEVVNHGPMPIRLRTGMRLCQLIFEQTLGTPDRGYQGQFANQAAPVR